MNLLLCPECENDFAEVLRHIGFAGKETQFRAHNICVLITGSDRKKTAETVAKTLSEKRYHLALFAGFAGSWKDTIPVGTIVNVIRETTAENSDFINRTNSYMNIFFGFKKVFSADKNLFEKADIHTENGAVFAEICLKNQQPFYQLRAIEKNVAAGETDHAKAKKIFNETLIAILEVI